jgi:uncharacterized protein
VARVDLKADRQNSCLLVQGAFSEAGVDHAYVARELLLELQEMATWLGLANIQIGDNGDLVTRLARLHRKS